MSKGKNKPHIVALLTGRGNNTLPDKNILPVAGRPLLHYVSQAALNSSLIDDYYVSSDCDKILEAAGLIGYKPIKRPSELAMPDSQHEDALKHALDFLKSEGKWPDILVVLLANSVTTKTNWIDDCIRGLIDDLSITSVSPVYKDPDHHVIRSKKIGSSGFLEPVISFEGQKVSTNRQDLEPSYFFCHTFWVLRTSNFDNLDKGQLPWRFMGDKIKPYILEDKTFDVHEEEDLIYSEQWLIKHKLL